MAQEGTELLDEQLSQAYEKAEELLEKGSYSRALRLLQKIERLQPDYRDITNLIPQAEEGKRLQTFVQWTAGLVAVLSVVIGWLLGVRNDLGLLALGAAGILAGIVVGNMLYAARSGGHERNQDDSQ